MIVLLADAAVQDLRAEFSGVLLLLLIAVVKAVLSHYDAKQAAAKATTEADKAAAAKIAANASADMAAAKQAGLDALVLYIESQKRKMTEAESKKTSGQIRVFTGLKDSEAVVAEAVTRLTKSGDTPKHGTTFLATPPPDNGAGNPFPTRPSAIMLAFLLPLALAGGCVQAAIHDATVKAQNKTWELRHTSMPDPDWKARWIGKPDPRGGTWTDASLNSQWIEAWESLGRAQDAIERGSR